MPLSTAVFLGGLVLLALVIMGWLNRSTIFEQFYVARVFITMRYRDWRVRRATERIGRLTGLAASFAKQVREELVDEELLRMVDLNTGSMYRIVGLRTGRFEREQLNEIELAYADTEIGTLAAVKHLANKGQLTFEMVEQFGYTGYQQQQAVADVDPLLASIRSSYQGGEIEVEDVDPAVLIDALRNRGVRGYRRFSAEFWGYLRPGKLASRHPALYHWFREIVRNHINRHHVGLTLDTSPDNKVMASSSRRQGLTEGLTHLDSDTSEETPNK